jgi:hypothetical protein
LVFDGPRRAAEAAWSFGVARRLAEPLLGPLPEPSDGLPPFELAIAERMALAAGCERLSGIFAAREVAPLAYSYLAAADSLRIRVAR